MSGLVDVERSSHDVVGFRFRRSPEGPVGAIGDAFLGLEAQRVESDHLLRPPGCKPYTPNMCRNIQQLRGAEPPATDAEVRDAALQFVRKVSGYRTPSVANAPAFEAAVDDVAAAVRRLLDGLVLGAGAKPVATLQRRRAAAGEGR